MSKTEVAFSRNRHFFSQSELLESILNGSEWWKKAGICTLYSVKLYNMYTFSKNGVISKTLLCYMFFYKHNVYKHTEPDFSVKN